MKISYPVILCVLLCITGDCLGQNWLWKAGGEGNDAATATTKDASGNIYTTGYYSSLATFGNTTYNTSGQSDIFITKHNAAGTMLWAKKAGGMLHDKAFSIASDVFGNCYVTGVYRGAATFENVTINSVSNTQDIFIAKYNVLGNLDWVKSAGGSETDISSAITVDSYGNAYITGQFKGQGTFENQTITSTPDSVGIPTYDIFIAKYNTLGNLVWLKQGASGYEDRGLSIAFDGNDYLYTTGQFSDTLTFTNTYNNNSYNSGYLLKLDLNGGEVWLKRFTAGVVTCNDVSASYPDRIYVTGDFSGTLMVSGPPYETTSSAYQKKIFLAQFNAAGQVVSLENDGSDNDLSARSVCTDAAGNAYITGNFKCTLTEYSALYGSGIFNSVGYNDVFVAKYNAQGQRQWERQLGSPGEDRAWGIEPSLPDNPLICGSFSKSFNAPSGPSFSVNSVSAHISDANPSSLDYCSDNNYGSYTSVVSSGQSDILLCQPIDLTRLPYDFYQRTGSQCVLDFIPAEIMGPDSIIACDSIFVSTITYTGTQETIGPDFNYAWSTGDTAFGFMVTQTGLYSVIMEHSDGCRTYTDSIYVTIIPTPTDPVIVSDYGHILAAYPVNTCRNKLVIMQGDTANLTISNLPTAPGYDFYWETPSGSVYDSDIAVSTGGSYIFHIIAGGSQQCESTNCVDVYIMTPADSANCQNLSDLDLGLHFLDSVFEVTDTVSICREGTFTMLLSDSASLADNVPFILPVFGNWTATGGLSFIQNIHTTFMEHSMHFKGLTSGMCTVSVTLLFPPNNIPFATYTRSFYLDITEVQAQNPVISGPQFLCPGDTVMVTIQHQGAGTLSVSGVNPIYISPGSDTLLINTPGNVQAMVTVTDTILGCSHNGIDEYELELKPPPIITMSPANGIICPFDSVMFTVPLAASYEWRGPDGDVISHTQTAYAHNAGLYHCLIVDLEGCPMISEPVEVREYATPFIDSDGSGAICAGQNVTIIVTAMEGADITWAPPLSGSSTEVVVTQPGTYSCSVTLCGITTQLSVDIDLATLTPVINVFGNDTICDGQTTMLSTLPGMSYYEWSSGDEGVNTLVVDQPGTYTVTVTDPNGCTFTSGAVVIYDAGAPPAAPVASDTIICAGQPAILNATSAWTVYWFSDPNTALPFASGYQYTTDTLLATITLFAASFDSTCFSEKVPVNVNVSLASLPPVITGDSMLCTGDTIHLFAENYLNTTYSWTGPGNFSSSVNEITITPADPSHQGIYSLSISDGICSSPASVVNVVVGTPPTAAITLPGLPEACEGDSILLIANAGFPTYSWVDAAPSGDSLWVIAGGDYWVAVSDSAGCTGVSDTTTITFLPAPTLAVPSDTIACPLESIQLTATSAAIIYWYSDSISSAPVDSGLTYTINVSLADTVIYAAAYDQHCFSSRVPVSINIHEFSSLPVIAGDSALCAGADVLLQAPLIQSVTYTWSGPTGDTLSTTNELSITAISVADSGVYYLAVSDGVCDVIADSAVIFVNPLPVAVIDVTGTTEFCDGGQVLLSSPAGFAGYEWLPGNNNENILLATDSGSYSIIVTDANGCSDTSDVILVTVYPLPAALAAIDTVVCRDVPFSVTAQGDSTIRWYDDNDVFLYSGNTYQLPGTSDPIELYVVVLDSNGCRSAQTPVNIDVNPLPAYFIISGGDSVCIESQASFSVDEFPGAIYHWATPAGAFTGDYHIDIVPVAMSDSGNYDVSVEYDGCFANALAVSLTVIDKWGAPGILGPDTVCVGDQFSLETSSSVNGDYVWITPGSGVVHSSSIDFTPVETNDQGAYTLMYNKLGCPSNISYKTLTVAYIPSPNAGNDTVSCIGNPVTLSLDSAYATTIWNNTYTTPTIDALDSGLYIVAVANDYGCFNWDSVYVGLVECNVTVQNILTPNNDGINDLFLIDDTYLEKINVIIYDRWGRMVYNWIEKASSWNGTNIRSGQTVPDGTYFYVMEAVKIDKTPTQQAGFIQVIK